MQHPPSHTCANILPPIHTQTSSLPHILKHPPSHTSPPSFSTRRGLKFCYTTIEGAIEESIYSNGPTIALSTTLLPIPLPPLSRLFFLPLTSFSKIFLKYVCVCRDCPFQQLTNNRPRHGNEKHLLCNPQ